MSDIGIRLDGVVLLAAIAFGVVTYFAIALIAGGRWLANRTAHRRSGRMAAAALCAAVFQVIVFAVIFAAANEPSTGPDIIDWVSIPYMLTCIAGYVVLARTGRAP
jgi:cytochrome bd-type quinol oxidase subunit 2